jgi:hypothetical protein
MTDKENKWVVNLNTITSYWLTMKYTWFTWSELTREKRFATLEQALAEAEKIQSKINKEGWMSVRFEDWSLKYIFYFASQIRNLSISEIEANEKTTDVTAILWIS